MGTVLIVDEQPVARHALRLLLEAEGYTVVGAVGDGTKAVMLAREHHPDLMTLELSVPGLGGLEVIQRLAKQAPTVKILVVTSQSSDYFAARCAEAGAFGFISKQDDLSQLIHAVNALSHGHTYFPRDLTHSINPVRLPVGEESAIKSLTARELTVLEMLSRGMSNNAIGEQLLLSYKTISTYKTRIMHKLNAHSALELLDMARRYGLVELSGFKGESTPALVLDPVQQNELDLLHSMINAVPHSITVRDVDGRLLLCNQYFLTQFDVKLENVLGQRIYESDVLGAIDATLAHRRLIAEMKRGQPYTTDVVLEIKGRQRVIRHWGHPYRDSTGTVVGLICGNVDITDRDEMLHDIQQTNVKLATSSKVNRAFISTVTAEIRVPLQNLTAMLELARDCPDPGKRDETLTVARAAAQEVQVLLNDCDSYLLFEEGSYPVIPTPGNVKELVEAHVDKFRRAAKDRGLTLEMDLMAARQNNVWVDSHIFGRIVDVLLSSAIKFTDNGPIGLQLYARGCGLGLIKVVLSIRDSGIGMPIADQKRLSSTFNKGAYGRRLIQSSGSGMGIALCNRLVERMNGEMILETREDQGSDISVSFKFTSAG